MTTARACCWPSARRYRRVSPGAPATTTVSITDNDVPAVTVSFGASAYTVAEGGTQSVTVTLSADPERTVVIPITATTQGGAGSTDYSGVPQSVTFNAGQVEDDHVHGGGRHGQ